MEIRVKVRGPGRMFRDRILERWGSAERLRALAPQNAEAREDLFLLERLTEKPSRLEIEHERTTVSSLTADDLARLSAGRLTLLDVIADAEDPLNVSQLARRSGRDKKNVSEDVALLAELGLVEKLEDGRAKRVRLRGPLVSIEIGLGPKAA